MNQNCPTMLLSMALLMAGRVAAESYAANVWTPDEYRVSSVMQACFANFIKRLFIR